MTKLSSVLFVRATPHLIRCLDRYVEAERKRYPGRRAVSRSDAVREILYKALGVVEERS